MSAAAEHAVAASDAEWLAKREELLKKEKELQKMKDDVAALRRELPWRRIDDYALVGEAGATTLSSLFGDKSDLVVYHFMFDSEWEKGCKVGAARIVWRGARPGRRRAHCVCRS